MTNAGEYPLFYGPWDDLKATVPLPGALYGQFEALAADLVPALESKTLRKRVLQLPIFTVQGLETRHHWQRAFLILSLLGQAYIWGKDEPVIHSLPLNISVAWAYVAKKLGSKPVITYLAVEFLNYRILNPELPLSLEYTRIALTRACW